MVDHLNISKKSKMSAINNCGHFSTIRLSKICASCGRVVDIDVPINEYQAHLTGKLHIQDAMPSLKPEEREMFLSGICGKCWDEIFKEEDL
jgi:Fe2+ or Zn2+ uptake regulation protein